jgi:hypothetical protein
MRAQPLMAGWGGGGEEGKCSIFDFLKLKNFPNSEGPGANSNTHSSFYSFTIKKDIAVKKIECFIWVMDDQAATAAT